MKEQLLQKLFKIKLVNGQLDNLKNLVLLIKSMNNWRLLNLLQNYWKF